MSFNIILNYRTELPSKSICDCKKLDYIYYTPCGADYATCPICCTNVDILNTDSDSDYNDDTLYDCEWNYCQHCKILFDGDIHAVNGCTDDTYSAIFINRFKIKIENEWKEYNGMPQLIDNKFIYYFKSDSFQILDVVYTDTRPVPIRYCLMSYYPYNINNNSIFYSKKNIKLFGEI